MNSLLCTLHLPLPLGRFFQNLAFVGYEIFDELTLLMVLSSCVTTFADEFPNAQHVV